MNSDIATRTFLSPVSGLCRAFDKPGEPPADTAAVGFNRSRSGLGVVSQLIAEGGAVQVGDGLGGNSAVMVVFMAPPVRPIDPFARIGAYAYRGRCPVQIQMRRSSPTITTDCFAQLPLVERDGPGAPAW